MPVLDYVTAVAAFGGLLLGLWAAWRTFLDDRAKLRVTAYLKHVDNSWLVDGGVDEVEFVKDFSSFGKLLTRVDATPLIRIRLSVSSMAISRCVARFREKDGPLVREHQRA